MLAHVQHQSVCRQRERNGDLQFSGTDSHSSISLPWYVHRRRLIPVKKTAELSAECLGEDLASCNNNDSDGSGCNGERSDRSSGEKLWTALGVSGGSAALGLVSVLALIAVVLVCKRKCRQRRSFSPESGSREAPVRRGELACLVDSQERMSQSVARISPYYTKYAT